MAVLKLGDDGVPEPLLAVGEVEHLAIPLEAPSEGVEVL